MEYRKLPHGKESISVLGIGTGGLQNNSTDEIERIIKKAIAMGINYFDLCCGAENIFAPFGKAIQNCRDKVYIQVHFGAVYDEKGAYGWTRELKRIKETFSWILKELNTDYVDMGFVHCIDDEDDFEEVKRNGILDYIVGLKEKGIVRHIGFSSHTPIVSNKLLDTGLMDMFMFSINPAYDFDLNSHDMGLSMGEVTERMDLFKRAEANGIGISVMKPFYAGKLLDENESPFKVPLSKNQCLQYALDRPAVLTTLPGIRNMNDLEELLPFINASKEELDYSIIGSFNKLITNGICVYCHHCQPCPKGLNIGLINKYYDLAKAGDKLAVLHYDKLNIKASECIHCHHCDKRCPFLVKQSDRMIEINNYFEEK